MWVPPGEGGWRRDDAHVNTVLTGFMDKLLWETQGAGLAEGFAYYGAMLAGFDYQWIAGRAYMRPKIAGAPAQKIWGDKAPAKIKGAGKLPPRFVFKLLMKLHPAMRKRARRAEEVYRTKAWRPVIERWATELKPAFVAENRTLTRVDIAALDDNALADHLDRATKALRQMIYQHFVHSPMQAVVVADLLVHARDWTGATPSEALEMLRGASPASRAGVDGELAVAKALLADPTSRALLDSGKAAGEIVDALKAAPGAVGDAMRELFEVYGLRPVTGLDLYHQSIADLPELLVKGLRAALAHPHEDDKIDPSAAIRARVPAENRAAFDELLQEARLAYGLRDDDAGVLLWRLGIVRRAVHEVGRRLASRGALEDAEHALDALSAELQALLRGGSAPTANELAERTAKRKELAAIDAPIHLGEEGSPPPPDYFPPAVARMMRAVQVFLAAFEGDRANTDGTDGKDVVGTGVSAGVYEGTARVVRDMADFAKIEEGDVLVARFTSPAYNVLLPLLGAIVTERGGLLSHAAIVAREYNIPGVVDTRDALTKIPDGSRVRVDGSAGTVEVIAAAPGSTAKPASPKPANNAPAISVPRVQPTTPGRVVALRDASSVQFGGKAKALAAAIAATLPVPDGVALDSDLVERVVAGEADARARVKAAVEKLGGSWAVRSSAIGEDSAQASFAGQHATILGVQPDELFDAIAKVHASGHTQSALAYRKKMGIAAAPRMGVVIQTLLCPDISGVLFSHDPTAKTKEGRLIEATWGLGEALVSGLVTPDRYRVSSDGKVVERAIGDKDIAIEARAGGGTAEVTIAAERAKTACLDDARLAELAQLANRCEQLFGGPQDLEWAVANGRLHLLQSRPVTTAAR
ncbi:MAG TPA: PEP/pyruvate-binding domain-containing protein [Kofleriaceae bacterium]|nr:PEP/pyruvate-binding domain-containing protein [Kofleriaceae bacterium]